MSLLALVALVSVTASNKIAEAPKCPSIVSAAISVPATPAAVTHEWICPALELSGQVQSDGLLLDPAFSESAPLADLARPGTSGHATLQGYGADGRTLFTFPFDANGPFKLILPLDAKTQSELRRLRLISGGKAVERTAATFSAVAYPEMRRFNYPQSFATGVIAAGGTLGAMLPPSTVSTQTRSSVSWTAKSQMSSSS